jgi:O-antigen ligase
MLMTKERHSYNSGIIGILLIFLVFFLFQLGGKMSIISLILLSFVACILIIINSKRWIIGVLFFLIPISILLITLNFSANLQNRVQALLNVENYQVGDNYWNSIGSRITALHCTYEVFKISPIIGTGIGDVQNDLDVCNEASEFQTLKGMNSHNQYLQFLLGTGVIGLLLFVAGLFSLTWFAYRQKNQLYLCFIFLFAFCCLTESLLERQQGIMFFSFFSSLLFFNVQRQSPSNK